MRRYGYAVSVCAVVLVFVVFAQRPAAGQGPRDTHQRPAAEQANRDAQLAAGQVLREAPIPHHYEPPSPSATAEDLEKKGDELRTQKAYADASDYYRAALRKTDVKSAQAGLYNKIGISELQMQHYKVAQKHFQRALHYNRDMAEARNNLGAALYLEKKYPKAIKEYKQAISLREDDASFHSNLGTAYFMRKELPLAMNEYLRAFQLDPTVFERTSQTGISAQLSTPENRAQYSYMLAKMYAQAGDLDRSIVCLKKAMEDGYKEIDNVYKDQEFTTLRKDPRFNELMTTKPTSIPE